MITATARLTSIKCLVGRMEFNQDVGNNFTHNWFLCVRMQKLTTSKRVVSFDLFISDAKLQSFLVNVIK